MKPAIAFGANSPAEAAEYIDQLGACTRCLSCKEIASSRRKTAEPASANETAHIDPEGLVCERCGLGRPLHYYNASTVKNRRRNKSQICNVCNCATLCKSCGQWKQSKDFRAGADSCKMCQLIICSACGENKKPDEYIRSHVYTFYSKGQNIQCEACHKAGMITRATKNKTYSESFIRTSRCKICGKNKQLRDFRRINWERTDMCRNCETLPCAGCAATLPQKDFSYRDANNFFSRGGRVVCLTCKKRGRSTRFPTQYMCTGPCKKHLPISAYPRFAHSLKRELPHMMCKTCTTNRKICQLIKCSTCGEEKKPDAYNHVHNFYLKSQNIQCEACHNAETITKAATNRTYSDSFCHTFPCRNCGEHKPLLDFRRKNWKRIDVCRKCETLQCARCAASLPRESFSNRDASNFFSRGSTVVCLQCKKCGFRSRHHEEYLCTGPCQKFLPISGFPRKTNELRQMMCIKCTTARQQRLQHLMKKSKRKKCTCNNQTTHTKKCPMHISFAGERPYPGCDVMSKADSDWLHRKRKWYTLPCRICGEHKPVVDFRSRHWKRTDVCRRCETVPCARCVASLPRDSFSWKDAYRFFTRGCTVVCLQCKNL